MREAAEAWERVFPSGAETARIGLRASSRGEPVAELRSEVVDVLAERLARADDPTPDDEPGGEADHPLFREVVWRCADRRDESLDWLAEELGARMDGRRPLPVLDEVRAWCRVVAAYEAVVAMSPERASASSPKLYYPMVRHAVWLHNERKQSRVANAMYRVGLRFADPVAHDSGRGLLRKNLTCGP